MEPVKDGKELKVEDGKLNIPVEARYWQNAVYMFIPTVTEMGYWSTLSVFCGYFRSAADYMDNKSRTTFQMSEKAIIIDTS